MEWFALIIPVLTVVVVLVWFPKRVVWWEMLIPFGVSVLAIALCKGIVGAVLTRDTEYWGSYAVEAAYYEDWDEKVVYYENVQERTGTDSKGRPTYRTKQVRKTRIDYHPAYWELRDSGGATLGIDSSRFDELCRRWGSREFVDLGRDYHMNDGDKYVAKFTGRDDQLEPVVTVHTYKNKVQASDSVFRFKDVDPTTYGLYEYPKPDNHYCPSILGGGGKNFAEGNRKLDVANAKMGASKQVRMWVLLFQGQPIEAAVDQENHWKGGNKNEFIVCIGHRGATVEWAYVFSWTEVEDLKVRARQQAMSMAELDLSAYADWLIPEIGAHWRRKEFADFNYLTVTSPGWAIAVVYIVTALACVGVAAWAVMNEVDEGGRRHRRGFRSRRSRYGGLRL